MIKSSRSEVKQMICDFLSSVVGYIVDLIYFGMTSLQQIILIVLAFFGPLLFALSMFPPFSNNMLTWFQKYISISFWGPIAMIIKTALYAILDEVAKVDGLFDNLFLLVVASLMGLSMFALPSLSSMVMNIGGGAGRFAALGERLAGSSTRNIWHKGRKFPRFYRNVRQISKNSPEGNGIREFYKELAHYSFNKGEYAKGYKDPTEIDLFHSISEAFQRLGLSKIDSDVMAKECMRDISNRTNQSPDSQSADTTQEPSMEYHNSQSNS